MFEEDFADRILPFDRAAAQAYAVIAATRRREGRAIKEADCQIGAIAASRGAALANRNVKDFIGSGAENREPVGPEIIAKAQTAICVSLAVGRVSLPGHREGRRIGRAIAPAYRSVLPRLPIEGRLLDTAAASILT